MKPIILSVLIFLAAPSAFAQDPGPIGKDILLRSHRATYPDEGSFNGRIIVTDEENAKKTYGIQVYRKGGLNQAIVFTAPSIIKNDAGIRSGDTIYFQARKDTRPIIQSYQADFVDSAFNWGDMTSADLTMDYAVTNLQESPKDGKMTYYLVLKPIKSGMYARIDVWIDRDTYLPIARDFFTASGELMKRAVYHDFQLQGARVVAFTVSVNHFLLDNQTDLEVKDIRAESLPKSMFDPRLIGRLHAR